WGGRAGPGRAAAAGALRTLGFGAPAMLVVVNALLVAAIAADLALAAPVRAIRLSRSGDTRVLLGECAAVELGVENPSRRTLRAVVRDPWQPSAGAAPPHARGPVPAAGGRPGAADHGAAPGPRGGQDRRRRHDPLAGPARARRPPGQAGGAVDGPGAPPVPQPQAPAGEAVPAAPARRAAPCPAPRPGQRVRLATRGRDRRRRAVHRLAGPPAAAGRAGRA